MTASLFQLPDELFYTSLLQQYPCRELQIRALVTLLHPEAAPCRNLVVYGTEATGKSVVIEAVLRSLSESSDPDDKQESGSTPATLRYAIVNSAECVTARHLFERAVSKVADALAWEGPVRGRCETLSQLAVELSKMLGGRGNNGDRFVLVFDAIDRQREAPPTMLPSLARLSETIPNLTTVFIVTYPPPSFLRTSFAPHVRFPNYTKAEFVEILSASPPAPLPPPTTPAETADLWSRFCGAVHDALARPAGRTLPALREACAALWPRFAAPVLAGARGAREFSKLLIAARALFQDEALLDPGLVVAAAVPPAVAPKKPTDAPTEAPVSTTTPAPLLSKPKQKPKPNPSTLSALLPTTARILLLCAYLASHNAAKHDLTLFSTHYHGRRRRRGGGGAARGPSLGRPRSKHRKIARKLLGAHAFALERVLAIFAAVRGEWITTDSNSAEQDASFSVGSNINISAVTDSDVGMALATLASLRLLVRVGGGAGGGGDPLDRGGKWRVNVGWEVVRSLGRDMGVEVEEWLID